MAKLTGEARSRHTVRDAMTAGLAMASILLPAPVANAASGRRHHRGDCNPKPTHRAATPAAQIDAKIAHHRPVNYDANRGFFWTDPTDLKNPDKFSTVPIKTPVPGQPGMEYVFRLVQTGKALNTIRAVALSAFASEEIFWGSDDQSLTATSDEGVIKLDDRHQPSITIHLSDGHRQTVNVGATQPGSPQDGDVGLVHYN